MPNILVIFSSLFGANAGLAKVAGSVLEGLGAQVRVRGVREVVLQESQTSSAKAAPLATAADLAWADGFVVSSPAHTGLPSAAIKAFIDENHNHAMAGAYLNKTFTAMTTSEFAHAGQENVVEFLNAAAASWGCILVPPSVANAEISKLVGNPYGLSFVLAHGRVADPKAAESVMRTHFARFVMVTDALGSVRAGRQSSPGNGAKAPLRAVDVLSR